MASNFEKRNKKLAEVVKQPEEVKVEEPVVKADLTHTAYDIFSTNGGGLYQVAEIKFNPDTKEAKVIEIYTITRQVALAYQNQKTGLQTLKRKLPKIT